MIVVRLLYLLGDYKSVEKEVPNIQGYADRTEALLDKVYKYSISVEQYLKYFPASGEFIGRLIRQFYKVVEFQTTDKAVSEQCSG